MDIDRDNANGTPSRSERWWFADGNVVLQAENTHFRVHQGILALHSSVFRDMFQVPQPAQSDSIDGCPLVHVSDTARELHHFLLALMETLDYQETIAHNFDAFVDCLRLATKYDVPPLRNAAVSHLCIWFPTTLGSYLTRQSRSGPKFNLPRRASFVIVNLVSELSLPRSILPVALYDCCERSIFSVKNVFDGYQAEDGSRVGLNAADLRRCLIGYERLAVVELYRIHSYMHVQPGGCLDPHDCSAARHALRREVKAEALEYVAFVLQTFADRYWDGLCAVCKTELKKVWETERQNVWNELPSYFELGSWTDLMDAQS